MYLSRMSLTFLDAVGAPASAFYAVATFFILLPFLFAGGMILLFRLLDRHSRRKEAKDKCR